MAPKRIATVPERSGPEPLKSVLMIVANPCDPDWRVMKEAGTLAEAGFEVTILAWDRDGTREPAATFGKARILRIRSPYLPGLGRTSRRILHTFRFWRKVAAA